MRPPGITGPEEQDGNEDETRMAAPRGNARDRRVQTGAREGAGISEKENLQERSRPSEAGTRSRRNAPADRRLVGQGQRSRPAIQGDGHEDRAADQSGGLASGIGKLTPHLITSGRRS